MPDREAPGRAVEAAARVARDVGVSVVDPEVLSVRSNVIVRLAPGGPVARVGGLTALVRDVRAHFARDVTVARSLAAAGAPTVAVHEPVGPHEHEGLFVTLWEEVPAGPSPDGPSCGRALRSCHNALAVHPPEVPPLRALFDEADLVLDAAGLDGRDAEMVRDGLHRVADAIDGLDLPVQPLHGDAGLGNVLPGPLWSDWEDSCVGPAAWDLACVVTTPRVFDAGVDRADSALCAYGDLSGADHFDLFVEARALQLAAWSALSLSSGQSSPDRLARRLEWLRAPGR